MAEQSYNKITVLEGMAGVRANLGMYLGSTGIVEGTKAPGALTQAVQEVMSNSLDELVAGFATCVKIELLPDNSVRISDDGRGVPDGQDHEHAINAFTKLHASGKGATGGYANEGVSGTHGIGIKACNAMSKRLDVWVQRDSDGEKTKYHLGFEKGALVEAKDIKRGSAHEWFAQHKTGTVVQFLPDDGPISDTKPKPVLESIVSDVDEVRLRAQTGAMLNPGAVVTVVDDRGDEPVEVTYSYPEGLKSYLVEQGKDESEIVIVEATTRASGHDFPIEFALTPGSGSLISYANGVPTREGGYHVDGISAEIGKTFTSYADKPKLKFTNKDVLSNVDILFHIKVPADIVEFEGQTKEKLSTASAKRATQNFVKSQLLDALYDNPKIADRVVQGIEDLLADQAAMAKAKAESKKTREVNRGPSLEISSKLKPAKSKNPAEKELYLVEGDSASDIGRNPMTQAVLPLRGKIRNVHNLSLAKALENTEFSTIVHALGAGAGKDFDIDKLAYHKVIISADRDQDGGHIEALLVGLFDRHFPGLIEAGVLYSVVAPLFKAVKYVKGKPVERMYYSDAEIDADRDFLRSDGGWEISRFKGLGEMDKAEVKKALGNPETRRLRQLVKVDADVARLSLNRALGSNKADAEMRQSWLLNEIGPAVWAHPDAVA